MCHTCKNRLQLQKCVTVEKMDYTWKKGSNWKNGSHLQERVTHALEKMGHTWKNGSQLIK